MKQLFFFALFALITITACQKDDALDIERSIDGTLVTPQPDDQPDRIIVYPPNCKGIDAVIAEAINQAPCNLCEVEIRHATYEGFPSVYVNIEDCDGVIGLADYVMWCDGQIRGSNMLGPYPPIDYAKLKTKGLIWKCGMPH